MKAIPILAELPKMVTVRQSFRTAPLPDAGDAVRMALAALPLSGRIHPGDRVAVTAGSRGITDIVTVLSAVVDVLKALGASPFIVPAMGSHGGATAEGQERMLAEYGITEARVGAPVRSSMAVVEVGRTPKGLSVYMDREACRADHVAVVNRVKPHTDFEAPVESGLMKMIAVGLGKQKGAEQFHNAVLHHGYYHTLIDMARTAVTHGPIAFGLGIVENQLEKTARVEAAMADGIEDLDRELLLVAKSLLPRIPLKAIDLLIVDEMGKDISGTGMDQNVIARTVIRVGTAPSAPAIRRIFVRDLTVKSRGMATGIGNADFTTRRLVERMDREATYTNCLTACEPEMAAIPPYYDTDAEAVAQAVRTIGLTAPAAARIVHIRNTLQLETFRVSEPLVAEAEDAGLTALSTPSALAFDAAGNLVSPLLEVQIP